MTEQELVNAAKVFQGNCLLNGDKMRFSEAAKIVLLNSLLENALKDKCVLTLYKEMLKLHKAGRVSRLIKKIWWW